MATTSLFKPAGPPVGELVAPVSIAAVERAMSELRRGGIVAIRDEDGGAALAIAAESLSTETQTRLNGLAASAPVLVITARRAEALRLEIPPHLAATLQRAGNAVTLELPGGVPAETIADLADPRAETGAGARTLVRPAASHASDVAVAAVELAKHARLLPAVLLGPLATDRHNRLRQWAQAEDLVYVDAQAVRHYEELAAKTLLPVAEARVPLEGAENARILAWRPRDGGKEHLAIVIGEINPTEPVLVRLHSECFTGDLLGSLRCDCGEQLRGAIAEIARAGAGVLLYLAQEGRGIGLVNKLRAYQLQDGGFDTIDANEQLGFDADERLFRPAATMLLRMGIRRVRVMTNNPDKLGQLSRHGVDVVERVPHVFPANGHNENYLRTKAERAGHIL